MKIAICTPVHSNPAFYYTTSLACLLTTEKAREIDYNAAQGSRVVAARNALVETSLGQGADWILWLDADHMFPPDTLSRLLDHGLDFVGCNYARREDPTFPTARKVEDLVWTTREAAGAGVVEPVEAIGFGVCLTSRRALEAIGSPWFAGESEDYHFCQKAIKAGFPPHVDHALSWQVGHVRESIVTNLHALMDRGRFKLKNNLT